MPSPPRGFFAIAVKLAVTKAADWNREFVADFATKRARLSEPKMMQVGRSTTTYQTGLLGDEFAVVLIAQADSLGEESERTGVDSVGTNA